MKKIIKPTIKVLCLIIALVLLVALGYVAYVFISYDRIDDMQQLDVYNSPTELVQAGQSMSIVSWNIGFGAYSQDYSFFMDGGKYSRAYSADEVKSNISGVTQLLNQQQADFVLLQEVDIDATRSYHIDEQQLITDALGGYGYIGAINYDSAYLFYPLTCPHGASKAEILTLTSFNAQSSIRRSLPIETGFMKFLDLDRCYSVTRIPVSNGKTLCLYNLHLSAYTSDGTIADEQVSMIVADMMNEYENGNYIIAGGDFNKDLLGDSSVYFGVSGDDYTWAKPFDSDLLTQQLTLVAPFDEDDPVPSCRNCDIGYVPGATFVLTVDGFIVSDNVSVLKSSVIDAQFENSDHNPVVMEFELQD
jgi:endonuclease/exonuclease/phosphatase family metal-dependent hydrolase